MTNDLAKLRFVLQQQLDESAHQGMLNPQKEPFDHGYQVGHYAAVKEVIQSIDHLLKDDPEE